MYDDFAKVFAAANNRNNLRFCLQLMDLTLIIHRTTFSQVPRQTQYLPALLSQVDDAFGTADVFKRGVNSNTSNAYYGRLNQRLLRPPNT